MFYRFSPTRNYPESTWIELWKLETSIHISFTEHFQQWKAMNETELENALRHTVNEWNAYYGAHGGHAHVSTYSIDEYLDHELSDIHHFMQSTPNYDGIPLHVKFFRQCTQQSSTFAQHIQEATQRTEAFFNQVED